MSNEIPERVTLSELPPKGTGGRSGSKYDTLAQWMREEPGTWFKIKEADHGSDAANFNNGSTKAFPKGEFEFAGRKNPETGLVVTWGRKPNAV